MRIPGLKRFRQSARRLRSRFVRHGLILGYHRVSEVAHDPYSMCVSPQHFAEQIEVLGRQTQPMRLTDMAEALQTGDLPTRSVVLTFDDGYADMLYQARPLLERYRIPATFFITTGQPGGEFWWDELERILRSASNLPAQLPVVIKNEGEVWNGVDTPHTRRRLLWSLYKKLLPLSGGEREDAMVQIRSWLGTETTAPADQRALTPNELVELSGSELVTIGAHTVTHPLLALLPVANQAEEIRQSKRYLEGVLGQPVTSFSYPNGSASEATLSLVRDSGFLCACASHNDIVWRGSDPFQLPRFWAPDWDGPTFSDWLKRWLPI